MPLLKPQAPTLKPRAAGAFICVHLRHLRIVGFGYFFFGLQTSDFGLVFIGVHRCASVAYPKRSSFHLRPSASSADNRFWPFLQSSAFGLQPDSLAFPTFPTRWFTFPLHLVPRAAGALSEVENR